MPRTLSKWPEWVIACILIFSSGCTIPRYLGAQADAHFTGVKIEDWEKPPKSGTRTIRVLLVHGMDNQPFGNHNNDTYTPELFGAPTYEKLQEKLATINSDASFRGSVIRAAVSQSWDQFVTKAAERLGNKEVSLPDHEFRLVNDSEGKPIGYTITRTFAPNANGVGLKFYIANWGLGAAVLKEQRFGSWGCLTTDNPAAHGYTQGEVNDFDRGLNGSRAQLNKLLKLQTMDWGMGDAALYLGDAGKEFRRPVTSALNQLVRQSGPDDRVAIVTHSLGSTITLDAMVPIINGQSGMRALFRATGGKNIIAPSHLVFYMFANQYGLLTIGEKESLTNLNAALAGAPLTKNDAVQIYAFTDPNDLLSYPLNPHLGRITTCNVYVRNFAVTFGYGTDPLETHLNYEYNDAVANVMLDGPRHVQTSGPLVLSK